MSTTKRPQTGWVKTCTHCGLRTPAHNDYPACIHCTKQQDTTGGNT